MQLFQNLIANALKYRSEAPPRIRTSVERQEPMWRLSVEDNGIGIARPYQSQVFGLFQRLHGGGKYRGSGIGLRSARKSCSATARCGSNRTWDEAQSSVFTLPAATYKSSGAGGSIARCSICKLRRGTGPQGVFRRDHAMELLCRRDARSEYADHFARVTPRWSRFELNAKEVTIPESI